MMDVDFLFELAKEEAPVRTEEETDDSKISLFEKDANRHVRIFCHPKFFHKLSKQREEIEHAIKAN